MQFNQARLGSLRSAPQAALGASRDHGSVLICDHRGSGLAGRLTFLADEGWDVEVAHDVRARREQITDAIPDALVLDPLSPSLGA